MPPNDYGIAETIAQFETEIGRLSDGGPVPDADFQQFYRYGDALRQAGRLSDALKVADILAKLGKESALRDSIVLLYKGEVLTDMGKHAAVEAAARAGSALSLSHIRGLMHRSQLAEALEKQERFAEAEAVLKGALDLPEDAEGGGDEVDNSDIAKLHFNIARYQRAQNLLPEAIASLKKGLELDSDWKYPPLVLGDLEAALSLSASLSDSATLAEQGDIHELGAMQKIVLYNTFSKRLTPGTGAEEAAMVELTYYYALALLQISHFSEALKVYEKLEKLPVHPRRWLIYMNKAQTLEDMGRFPEAEAARRTACQLDESVTPRVYLARNLELQERFAEATDVLREALPCRGDTADVLLHLSRNLRTLGQLEQAELHLEEALELNPDSEEIEEELADVQGALWYK